MARKLTKNYTIKPPKDAYAQSNVRIELREIFDKLSTDDLWKMAKCLIRLNLVGFCLSYCLEILEDRWVLPWCYNDLMGN